MMAVLLASVSGAVIASVLACVPGLHIYNLLALLVIGFHTLAASGSFVSPEAVVPLMLAMMVGFAMVNTIPSILLAAPDESALFTVLPGQKYLMQGRGYEGVMVTGAGGLMGAGVLILLVGPLAPRLLPAAQTVLRPHTHWILWAVITFMLMSEWPKGGRLGEAGWRMFWDGWKTTGAGLLTFLLAGLLGFVLLYRSPVAVGVAFQNLMPAFVGLFTVPWLLLNLISGVTIPHQQMGCLRAPTGGLLVQGTFAGVLGGLFAAFFPVITGGVGGWLAGHATAMRDDRVFLVSQGASKFIYYVGGLLFFFLPGLGLTRGGAAWMMKGLYVPHTLYDYLMALAAISLATAVSFLLLGPLTRAMMALLKRVDYRLISAATLLVTLLLVIGITGVMGLFLMLVATGIGLLPVMFGSRRMNCLSVILLPMACNMSGVGPTVAGWLGLV